MKTIWMAVTAAAALLVVLALPAGASTQAEPSVLCWNKDFPPPTGNTGPAVKQEPRKCWFFKNGASDAAGSVNVRALTWKNWGASKTTGKGKVDVPMTDDVVKVKVSLSKPVASSGCTNDPDVYSKLALSSADGDADSFKLWTSCAKK